ncbi:MAG: transporter, partial [Polyangia bacterium]
MQCRLRSRIFALMAKKGLIPAVGLMVALGLMFAAVPRAHAQQLRLAPIDLQAFRPAMDSKGYITLNSSQVLGKFDFSFGLVTTWGARVLDLKNPAIAPPGAGGSSEFAIRHIVTPSLQGAVGLTNFAHFGVELGLVIPMSILSGRSYPTETNGTTPANDDTDYSITEQGLGDMILSPKIRLMNAARNSLGVAIIPSMVLPTGDKHKFLGEGQFIFQPSAVIDGEFGYLGRFRVAINAGMRLRGTESVFIDDGTVHTAPRTFGGAAGVSTNTQYGVRVKNEALGGVGLS